MKTGKLFVSSAQPYQSRTDENSYILKLFIKSTGQPGGKLHPQDKSSTRLQKLSLMKKTYFGVFHYDIHLHMKVD